MTKGTAFGLVKPEKLRMKSAKIRIQGKYKRITIPFKKRPKQSTQPEIPVILKSTISSSETQFAKRFLLDTGASISIINSIYSRFVANLKQIDTLDIQYGAGETKVTTV